MGDFNAQDLANTAWAFATAGELTPALLGPIVVLDTMEVQGAKPQVMCYQMSMQGLAATGQIEASFVLLAREKVSGSLLHSGDSCCPMFRTPLEACRLVGDSNSASQVQAEVEWLGLITLAPMATALVQGSLPVRSGW